jgi:DHA1 family multidrug resistance protein-like MFS transporter
VGSLPLPRRRGGHALQGDAADAPPEGRVARAATAPTRLTVAEERRNLAVLWLGCYLTSASWSLVMPFMPILLRQLGVAPAHLSTWTGVTFASTFATAIFASPVWGAWADAVGRKVNMLRSGITITVVMLGMGNAGSPWLVLFWRLVNGAFSGFIPAAYALVAATVPEQRLGRSLGILQTGPSAGAITGPLIGGALVQLTGIRATFYLAAAAQLVATALVLAVVREPEPPRRGLRLDLFGGLAQALRNRLLRTVLLTTVISQLAVTTVEPLITIYVGQFPGVTAVPFLAGLLFSLVGVASVLCSPLWGRAGERLGFGRVALWGLLGAAAGNALQLAVHSLAGFGLVRLLTGAAYAGANTGLATLAATSVDESFRGRAYGLLTSSQQMGNLFGPLLGGLCGDLAGIPSAFGLAAAVSLCACGTLALLGVRRLPARPFVDTPSG